MSTNRRAAFFKRGRNKKEYSILSASTDSRLSKIVNEALKEGWDLLGGVGYTAVKTGGNQYYHKQFDQWYQSMVREK